MPDARQQRGDDPGTPDLARGVPGGAGRPAAARTEPDIGFSESAYGWAAGRSLADVLADSDLTAGDFVRWVRQVADFAGQIADAAGPGELRDTARGWSAHAPRRGELRPRG